MRIPRIRRNIAFRSAFLSGALSALALFVAIFLSASIDSNHHASAATSVTLTVDASQQVNPFRDTMRGVATNNWNWLWSGLWDRSGSCCPAGKHDAIVDATAQLEPGIIRFAGGLWANGVGWDRAGTSPDDGNWTYTDPDTGQQYSYTHSYKPAMVDAFQQFRMQVGPGGGKAEAIIQVDVCDNNPKMWADLVKYSVEKGYNFEYWEIGNEQTLDSCGLTATTYAQRYDVYQNALKAVDPSIKVLGPINHQPTYSSWEDALVNQEGQNLDVLAWHWYQLTEWNSNPSTFAYQGGSVDALLAWGGNVGSVTQDGFGAPGDPNSIPDGRIDRWTYRRGIAEQQMSYIQSNYVDTGKVKPDLETAITEFGVHASAHTNPINGNHLAAIWLADMLPRWAYNGLDIVTYYSLEDGGTGAGNSRGLFGTDSSTALDVRATYDTEWLLAHHFGDMMVKSDTSDPEKKVVAWASTDSSDPSKLKLMLVNLSGDTAAARLQISGFTPQSGQAYVMVSDDPTSVADPDSFTNPSTKINGVKIPDYQVNNGAAFHAALDSIQPVTIAASSDFSYSIPPYAVVALELSGDAAPVSTPTATPPATATPTASPTAAVPTATPTTAPGATATATPASGGPTSTPTPLQSGQWPSRLDLNVGESRAYTLQNGQTRTVTLVSYDRVIPRQLITATVRVDGGGRSVTHTIDVTHAGVPVAMNGVWVHGYAWKEADDNGFEDVARQGGFPLTPGKDVGLAVNDAMYPFYPNLNDYTYPIEGAAFNDGAYLQTWLDPDGWAHSGFDIGVNDNTRLLAITDGYVWSQYYSGQGLTWITTGPDQWSSPCWVFTHILQGSVLVPDGTHVTKGTPIVDGIFGSSGIHTHMGSCGIADLGSWLFAASVWNNEHADNYPAPRYWLGLGSYSGSIATNKIAADESGNLPAGFAPEAGDTDLSGSQAWRVTDNFVNSVVRVGEVLSAAPYSGYSDRVGSNSMGYIATYVYSPVDYSGSSAVHLKLGVTRGARVWLNGTKVHDATEARYDTYSIQTQPAIVIDKYDYVLPLQRGWNLLIIKSDNGSRSDTFWGVSPKIGDASGNRMPGLVFSTRDTKLSATGGNGSVSLGWSPVDFHGASVDSYRIDIATDPAFSNVLTTLNAGTGASASLSGLAGGVTYYARLRPYNDSQLGGSTYWEHSDEVSFTTTGSSPGATLTPPAPTATPVAQPTATRTPTATPTRTPTTVPTATATSALGSTATPASTSTPTSSLSLVFTQNANRSNPSSMNSQTVSGSIYVFTQPDTGVSQVAFYVDDPSRSGSAYRTESVAPFDLAGTNDNNGNGNPFDTTQLVNGTHTFTAVVSRTSGGPQVMSGSLNVQNAGSPQPTATSTSTSTPTATNTPNPTATSTSTPTATAVPTATSQPTATSTASPTATVVSAPTQPPSGGGFIPAPTSTPVPTVSVPVAPGAPQKVTATATGNGEITLTIIPPISDGGLPVTGYRALMTPTGALIFIDRATYGDTYVVTGLEPGIEYQFQVRASNAAGLSAQAALSNTVLLRDTSPTPTPVVQGSAPDAPGSGTTPTAQPVNTATPTPQPTAAPSPTTTPTAIPTPTASPTAIPTPTVTPEPGATFTIALIKGWNLVSFQALPSDRRVENVLASIDGMYTEVNTIAGDQTLVYTPETAASGDATLLTIDETHGYWIKMKDAALLEVTGYPVDPSTTINLQVGWNLVSYLSSDSMPVRQALGTIAGKYDEVRGFDTEAMSFFPALPAEFNTLTDMKPGSGYLIHMTESGQLVYP